MPNTVPTPIPARRLTFTDDGHVNPEQLAEVLADADVRGAHAGLTYVAGHTAVPATFQAASDTPCEAHIWCVETGQHLDHMGRRVAMKTRHGAELLTAYLYADQPAGLPALSFDPGMDDWDEHSDGAPLRAYTAKVRAHLARLDAFADEYDALREASSEQFDSVSELDPSRRAFVFETVELDADTPLVLRATRKRVHVGWDPRQATHAQAVKLFHLCAQSAGVDTTGVDFPTVRQTEAEEHRSPYVPPTDWDQAEAITCAGERGAILKAALYTPTWHGIPEGPTRVAIYNEPGSEGELDVAGTDKFIVDLGALLPKLAAMRAVLAAGQEQAPAGPLTAVAEALAMEAVTASLTGLPTNPNDVSKRLHRSIDNAQGRHLAEVGGHAEAHAYASSRFAAAVDAMADALGAASDRAQMVRALRNALEMVIEEAR